MRRRDERGAAAVEMAILTLLLVALLGVVGPLMVAIQEQVRLGRTSGAAVRFATATPDRRRSDCDGAPTANYRRPSVAQVVREAECVRFGSDTPDGAFSVTVVPAAQIGDEVRVTVSNTVGLGPLGEFLGRGSVTLTSTSIGIQE